MGYYINPPGQSKERWLEENGNPLPLNTKWENIPGGHLPVILVDNSVFTAAAIGYSKSEFEYFLDPEDRRLKKMYYVPIKKLLDVADEGFKSYVEKYDLLKNQ